MKATFKAVLSAPSLSSEHVEMGGWAVGKRMEKLHRGYKKRGWRLKGGLTNDLRIHCCTIHAHDTEVRSVKYVFVFFLLSEGRVNFCTWPSGCGFCCSVDRM